MQAKGAEKAAQTTATTDIGIIGSIEQFLTKTFVVVAIAVMGVVFVAFGLGLFNKRTVTTMVQAPLKGMKV